MTSPFRILTVCTGNVHRSPLAATLLDRWAHWYLPADSAKQVSVTSAGTGAPVGAPMGSRALAIARSFGGDGTAHRAAQITDQALSSADLILVASRRHRDEVLGRVPSILRRTFTIREAGRIAAHVDSPTPSRTPDDLRHLVTALADARPSAAGDPIADDIVDPQGLGDDAYLQMVAEEIPPLASLAGLLFGMSRGDLDAYAAASRDPALLDGLS